MGYATKTLQISKKESHTHTAHFAKNTIFYILSEILHSIKITLKLSHIFNPQLPSHAFILIYNIMPVKYTSLLLPQN